METNRISKKSILECFKGNIMNISQKRLDKGLYWERAWTLVNGCMKVSEGCQNCWSKDMAYRFNKSDLVFRYCEPKGEGLCEHKTEWTGNIQLNEDRLDLPLKIKKPTVFAIWNDLFHEKVPNNFLHRAFSVMTSDNVKQHIFLILTKRPKLMKRYLTGFSLMYAKNIYFGVTIESPKYLWRVEELLKIPAKNKFLSIEPMLENIDIYYYIQKFKESFVGGFKYNQYINWIIVGAESGPRRRPCNIEWIRSIRDQCQSAGVPLFIKQIHIDGKLIKDINKFPEDLRIREFPK